MRGKTKLRIPPRPAKDWEEILAVTLNQRRRDANGNRLQGHGLEEIAAMTPAERDEVKVRGWRNNGRQNH
jgi:hypothetical protein